MLGPASVHLSADIRGPIHFMWSRNHVIFACTIISSISAKRWCICTYRFMSYGLDALLPWWIWFRNISPSFIKIHDINADHFSGTLVNFHVFYSNWQPNVTDYKRKWKTVRIDGVNFDEWWRNIAKCWTRFTWAGYTATLLLHVV